MLTPIFRQTYFVHIYFLDVTVYYKITSASDIDIELL